MKKLKAPLIFTGVLGTILTAAYLILSPNTVQSQGLPAPNACPQFFAANGTPLAGGILSTLRSGTLIPQATFTDATLSTPNPTPMILDAGGYATNPSGGCGLWLDPTLTYTFTLRNAQGVQVWSVDGITSGNFAILLSSANVWTGVQTFTGGIVVQGPATMQNVGINGTGHINNLQCNTFQGNACVDSSNSQQWPGSDAGAWINSAYASSTSVGAAILLAAGTYSASTQIIVGTHPTWIQGAGIGSTILNATSLGFPAIKINGPNVKISDLTINMTATPTQTALQYINTILPILENVQILYPASTGTGTAVSMTGVAGIHMRNLIVKGAGICVDEQGDASGENFYDDIVCEDPGSFGYRRQQTTGSDVGGEYLTHFKVTNPDNRTTAQAFVVTSLSANTGSPFFCLQCVGDNMKGGHTYQIHNMVNVFLDTPWATNTAAIGNNFAAINIDTSTDVFIKGGYMASLSRDLTLSGTDITVSLISNFFAGLATNIYATGATLSNIVLRDPIYSAATPISAADRGFILAAASTFPSANGFIVDVSGTGAAPSTFTLHDVDAADATPNAYIRTGANVGTFQLLNNAFLQTFAVNETGTVATLGASRVVFHGYQGSCAMSSGTTCTFAITAAFTGTPLTYASIDAQSAVPGTANVAKCSVSGTTVTITAGGSNSLTWDCLLVGNPD